MIAPTQLINIKRGSHEIAIDLSAQQALSLKGNSKLKVLTTPSTWVFWLYANNDPAISSFATNKSFQQGSATPWTTGASARSRVPARSRPPV
jgi:peptide/nickel transport system substrate-binding protein